MNNLNFSADGFVFVQVYLKPNGITTMQSATYKVDSGANCTTISRDELLKLGYDENWIRQGKHLVGENAPTVASGSPIEDCYEVIRRCGTKTRKGLIFQVCFCSEAWTIGNLIAKRRMRYNMIPL